MCMPNRFTHWGRIIQTNAFSSIVMLPFWERFLALNSVTNFHTIKLINHRTQNTKKIIHNKFYIGLLNESGENYIYYAQKKVSLFIRYRKL